MDEDEGQIFAIALAYLKVYGQAIFKKTAPIDKCDEIFNGFLKKGFYNKAKLAEALHLIVLAAQIKMEFLWLSKLSDPEQIAGVEASLHAMLFWFSRGLYLAIERLISIRAKQ